MATPSQRLTRSQTSGIGTESSPGVAVSSDDLQRMMSNAIAGSLGYAPHVKSFDGNSTSDALDFLDSYIEMSSVRGWDDKVKFLNFPSFLEGNAKNWYKLNVKKGDKPLEDWESLSALFITRYLDKDRRLAMKRKLEQRKQSTEDVMAYITDKRLLCAEFDPKMKFDDIKEFVIAGLKPEIRAPMRYLNNNSIEALEENAFKVEKGKWSGDNR